MMQQRRRRKKRKKRATKTSIRPSGVENVDSDDNADDVSEDDGSLGVPPLEEMIQFMLTLSKGN